MAIIVLGIALTSCSNIFPPPMPPMESTTPSLQTASWAINWWHPRHIEKLEFAKLKFEQQEDVDLILLGDSITHGWEKDNADKVWHQYYPDINTFNLGFNGDRTEHVLWRLKNGAVTELSPKLIVLMIGTNNTGQKMDPAEHTALGVKAIIDQLQASLPTTKILLLGIFPRTKSPHNDMRKRNNQINRLIADFADGKRVVYLNINQHFLDSKGNLSKTVMPDLLHPNKHGYQIWASAMAPVVNKLLK